MNASLSRLRSQRGSLLIVAMLLCAIIGICLASYIKMARTSLTISNRALYNNGAINLAENGLEEAMYAINQMVADDTYAWPGWSNDGTSSTSNAWRKWTGYTFDQGTTGIVRVYVYNYKGTVAPKIVARSTITLGGATSASIEKWIEVQLRKTSKFANGLVAKNSVLFKGSNASVDSWNSGWTAGSNAATTPYSAGVRRDNGSVGSISVGVNAVNVNQADIWGWVATGGTDPTSTVGTNGSILGSGSTYDPTTWTKSTVDPARVSTDFAASFDAVTAPTTTAYSLGNINTNTTLPRGTDVAAADGKYYYTATSISLTNKALDITGSNKNVVITVSGDVSTGGGSGTIQVNNGASLALYVNGNISLSGQGAVNGTPSNPSSGPTLTEAQAPAKLQIYGTNPTSQTVSISGNGAISAVVYAPTADVSFVGNALVLGSVVANNITCTGNANFHYDEALADFGGGNPYRVSKWKELTLAADRNAYNSLLSF